MTEIIAKINEIIACPQCRGFLKYQENYLTCSKCRLDYQIIDDIPLLIDKVIISQRPTDKNKKRKQAELNIFNDTVTYRELSSRPYFMALKNKIKTQLQNYHWQNKTILEIGAGLSDFADLFVQNNNLILTDLNAKLLAQNTANCQKIAADAEALPFQDKTFDFIYVIGVLHHLPDQAQALQELKRVIKSDGRIFIAEPVRFSLNYPYYLGRKIVLKLLGEKKLKQLIGCVTPNETFVRLGAIKKIFKNHEIKKTFILPFRLPPFKKLGKQKWIISFNNFLEKIPIINKLGTFIFIAINYE